MSIKDHVDMTVPSKRACSVEWVIDLGSTWLAECDVAIRLKVMIQVSFRSVAYQQED